MILNREHLNIGFGWSSKVISVFINFYNVKLLFSLLGVDGVAFHAIVISVGGWLGLTTFGLPSLILNHLTEKLTSYEINEIKSQYFTSMVLLLFFGSLVCLLLTFFVFFWVDVENVNVSFWAVFALLYSQLFLALTEIPNKVLLAEGKPLFPNLMNSIVSISTLLLLSCMLASGVNNINLLFYIYIMPYLLAFIIASSIAFCKMDFSYSIKLIIAKRKSAYQFFLFALMSACVLRVDYLLLALFVDADGIAKYMLLFKIFMSVFFLYTVVLSMLWPKLSRLKNQGDFLGIKSSVLNSLSLGFTLVSSFSIFFCVFRDRSVAVLSDGEVLSVELTLVFLMALYFIVRVWTDTFAVLLQSDGNTRMLLKITPIQATLNLVVGYFFVAKFGVYGLLVAALISYLSTVSWYLPFAYFKEKKERIAL